MTDLGADHYNVYGVFCQSSNKVRRADRDGVICPVSLECIRQKITAHGIAIHDQDAKCRLGILINATVAPFLVRFQHHLLTPFRP
jgi:hypothetical protein